MCLLNNSISHLMGEWLSWYLRIACYSLATPATVAPTSRRCRKVLRLLSEGACWCPMPKILKENHRQVLGTGKVIGKPCLLDGLDSSRHEICPKGLLCFFENSSYQSLGHGPDSCHILLADLSSPPVVDKSRLRRLDRRRGTLERPLCPG